MGTLVDEFVNRFLLIAAVAATVLAACGRKPESTGPERHFQLSGEVLAINSHDRTATIKAAAIPGWMDAMTMEYPVRSSSDFGRLHTGHKIKATVNVRSEGDYDLSNIQEQ